MKKILIILFLFIQHHSFAQIESPIKRYNGKIVVFQGNLIQQNTLLNGLILNLNANSIDADSLTFNSSGDLVTYSNQDTVVLDGNSDVLIGSSCRFGSALSGTIYQILDTLGSSDSLILDQNFGGSVTDEFFWGGIGKIYDESVYSNNALQTTAIYQPKLKWAGTDSASIAFDGIDDFLQVTETASIYIGTSDYSILYILKTNIDSDFSPFSYGGGYNTSNPGLTIRYNLTGINYYQLSSSLTLYSNSTFEGHSEPIMTDFNSFCYTSDRDGNALQYLNGIIDGSAKDISTSDGDDINPSTSFLTIGSTSTSSRFLYGEMKNIYIYKKVLTQSEIQLLSQ